MTITPLGPQRTDSTRGYRLTLSSGTGAALTFAGSEPLTATLSRAGTTITLSSSDPTPAIAWTTAPNVVTLTVAAATATLLGAGAVDVDVTVDAGGVPLEAFTGALALTAPGSGAGLVSPAEAVLALPWLSPAALADLPGVIAQATRLIESYCSRRFAPAAYDELHAPGRTRTVRLGQRPVLAVDRVASGAYAVLRVAYAGPASRATVAYATTGEAPTVTATGLALATTTAGATSAATLSFADYPTAATLAAQINTLSGWSATVAPGYDGWATADLTPSIGARNALNNGSGVELFAFVSDWTDYDLDPTSGTIVLGAGWPYSAAGSGRGGGTADVFRFPDRLWGCAPRFGQVRVTYRAGYQPAPPDLQRACIRLVHAIVDSEAVSGVYKSETAGTDSYTLSERKNLLDEVMPMLSSYRRLGC